MPFITTLEILRHFHACRPGYDHLVSCLGPTYQNDTPIQLTTILKHNSVADTLWALRACDLTLTEEKQIHLLACDYADHTLHLYENRHPNDNRPRRYIEIKRLYVEGKATLGELHAYYAADADAGAAVYYAASYTAAYYAADADAGAAVYYAASYAADAASYAADAAPCAADAAPYAAEHEWQAKKLKEIIG